jgi:hypothetical protein
MCVSNTSHLEHAGRTIEILAKTYADTTSVGAVAFATRGPSDLCR